MHYNLSDEQKIFLHVSYSMLEEGYDVDQIMEFWNLDDESKALEIYESITLSETIDTSNPDFLLICERMDIRGYLMRLLGRGGRGVKIKPPAVKPPANKPPTTTRGGRPITSSGGGPKPDATKPPTTKPVTGQKPSLTQRVKDKIPPAMRDKIRQGAATALTTGAIFGAGALLMNKGDIPGIPDAPEPQPSKPEESGKDPLANESTDTSTDSSSSTDSTSSSTTSDTRAERKRRNYAWASINNRPKNFYRNDPAYYHTKSKYMNIRGNPIPKEYK